MSIAAEIRATAEPAERSSRAVPTASLALWLCLASVAANVALRVLYLQQPLRVDYATFPMFLNDEGALGLMAMHIVERGALPIFYYGGYYLGALDAYLSAGSFAALGPSLFAHRLTPSILSILQIPLAYLVARHLFGRTGALLAAALVALPSNFVFEWGSKSMVGFYLHTSFLLSTLYLFLRILEDCTPARLGLLAFTTGVAIWNNFLVFPYAVLYAAALFLWVPMRRKDVWVLVIAGAVGLAPLLYGNIVHPLATPRALARKVFFSWSLAKQEVPAEAEVDEEEEEGGAYRSLPILEVLGAQPAKDGTWSAPGAAGAAFLVVGFFGALAEALRVRRRDPDRWRGLLLVLGAVAVSFGVGIAGFSGQPVARYQIPLYALLAVVSAGWLAGRGPRAALAVVAFFVVVHGVSLATPTPSDGRTSRYAIRDALLEKGLHYGYAGGQMFDLVFLSEERIRLVPLGHSRVLAYEPEVAAADRIFYLFRSDQTDKPAHRVLLEHLQREGAQYQRMTVGDYHVLYDFEPREVLSAAAIEQIRDEFLRRKGRR